MRADLVTDDLWGRVAPLLPPAPELRRHPGRLRVPDGAALAGAMYAAGGLRAPGGDDLRPAAMQLGPCQV
ncbi:Mobile element protein [Streptomyces venezuelae]|nr:Mobile element protein [Streptomyces venezuelae]